MDAVLHPMFWWSLVLLLRAIIASDDPGTGPFDACSNSLRIDDVVWPPPAEDLITNYVLSHLNWTLATGQLVADAAEHTRRAPFAHSSFDCVFPDDVIRAVAAETVDDPASIDTAARLAGGWRRDDLEYDGAEGSLAWLDDGDDQAFAVEASACACGFTGMIYASGVAVSQRNHPSSEFILPKRLCASLVHQDAAHGATLCARLRDYAPPGAAAVVPRGPARAAYVRRFLVQHGKWGLSDSRRMGPHTRAFVRALKSQPWLTFLEEVHV